MDIEKIKDYCLSLPHATTDIQWENDLLFRVGGKIFAGVGLDGASSGHLSFKCSPEEFSELIEREGIVPAPYTARYHWVMIERFDGLRSGEVRRLIRDSYEMVFAKLPNKVKATLKGSE
ncbi:MAG TPA: MmcQ/YjbR family DNA-binding protein [Blastocatellia bacterium]|jgi:predicted DNA-binding protein (MmcQ/YjbR family)|nr:MmcQ/YjbR family DNA-binding protein [Blastocatellia bacterium]